LSESAEIEKEKGCECGENKTVLHSGVELV
jgi:hypothetical protein